MEVLLFVCVIFSLYLDVSYSQLVPSTNGTLLNTIELMDFHGFKGERHEVTTEDGYKLSIFRIPPKQTPAPVVLLTHGLSLSSDVYVLEKNAFAFVLSRKGYDVWLGNSRGNIYGHNHEKLSSNDTKFWDFTHHELGYYDTPAYIDYILTNTKQPSLYYIGHSGGTTMFYIMGSLRPEYLKKVKAMFSLAPVVYFTGKIAAFAKQPTYVKMSQQCMDKWLKEDNKVEAFPRIEFAHGYHQLNCSDVPENFVSFCQAILEMVQDAVGGAYIPAGMSTKTLLHFRQHVLSESFKQFDYESESANQAKYKSSKPPDYDLSLVNVPVYLIYGPADILADGNDVMTLKEKLPNVAEVYKVPDEKFGHTDYVFIMADEDEEDRTHFRLDLYDQISKWIDKMEKM